LKKTKLEVLQFLKFFVESAAKKIVPHAVELKSILLIIFHVDSASDVRAAIFPILTQVSRSRFVSFRFVSAPIDRLVDGIVRCFDRDATGSGQDGHDLSRSDRIAELQDNSDE
jgi:hypothetical protein